MNGNGQPAPGQEQGGVGGPGGPGIGGGGGGGGDIDLGEPSPSLPMPAEGAAAPPSGPQYPSVMLTGDQALSKIPDKGSAVIRHSVISRRIHTPQHGPHKGKQRHEVEIHLHSIRPIRGYNKAPKKTKINPDEKAMRKLMGDESEGEEEE